jgi:hypothetical protein
MGGHLDHFGWLPGCHQPSTHARCAPLARGEDRGRAQREGACDGPRAYADGALDAERIAAEGRVVGHDIVHGAVQAADPQLCQKRVGDGRTQHEHDARMPG